MDIETLEKVIEMLDARIEDRSENLLTQVSEYFELVLFKDHLQKYVDKQVAHMETEQGM